MKAHALLITVLYGLQWLARRFCRFATWGKSKRYLPDMRVEFPIEIPDAMTKKEKLRRSQESNPEHYWRFYPDFCADTK
jgi:hypothetical protein